MFSEKIRVADKTRSCASCKKYGDCHGFHNSYGSLKPAQRYFGIPWGDVDPAPVPLSKHASQHSTKPAVTFNMAHVYSLGKFIVQSMSCTDGRQRISLLSYHRYPTLWYFASLIPSWAGSLKPVPYAFLSWPRCPYRDYGHSSDFRRILVSVFIKGRADCCSILSIYRIHYDTLRIYSK